MVAKWVGLRVHVLRTQKEDKKSTLKGREAEVTSTVRKAYPTMEPMRETLFSKRAPLYYQ